MRMPRPLRGFLLAVQFLTRLPTPQIADFRPEDLSRSAIWFPLVGAIIGSIVVGATLLGLLVSPWFAALLGLCAWVWVTGGLHLDGLGDMADALGAAHRSPERFAEVLKDPHTGAFAVMAIGLQLIAKFVLIAECAVDGKVLAMVLVPVAARWSTLVLSLTVPPLKAGMGERFAWDIPVANVVVQGLLIAAAMAWRRPALLALAVILPLAVLYWRRRIGGITGDGLGASMEVIETLLLMVLVAS